MSVPFCFEPNDSQSVGLLAVFGPANTLAETLALCFSETDLTNLLAHFLCPPPFSLILPEIITSGIFSESECVHMEP